ncbi:hypothetical protein HPB51_011242 [Rhipicephalus microplus]|uniref:Uncharacterized protein n=1 Tax=Rhipicephalus microplus TaxID=6941 RepID=A0A9J6F1E7_RHIMP|nr:hypothetical protein HPB51_011242 [Rhipicephalus microplus]
MALIGSAPSASTSEESRVTDGSAGVDGTCLGSENRVPLPATVWNERAVRVVNIDNNRRHCVPPAAPPRSSPRGRGALRVVFVKQRHGHFYLSPRSSLQLVLILSGFLPAEFAGWGGLCRVTLGRYWRLPCGVGHWKHDCPDRAQREFSSLCSEMDRVEYGFECDCPRG